MDSGNSIFCCLCGARQAFIDNGELCLRQNWQMTRLDPLHRNAKPECGEQKPEDPAWLESENVVLNISMEFLCLVVACTLPLIYLTTRPDSGVHCSAFSTQLIVRKIRTETVLECETFGMVFVSLNILLRRDQTSIICFVKRMRTSARTLRTHTHTPTRHKLKTYYYLLASRAVDLGIMCAYIFFTLS